MEPAAKQYIEFSEGDYIVTGSRVLLEALVYEFLDGRSPESIQQSFPTLKLAQVYGAITFYLDHQAAIDKYLEDTKKEFEGRGIPMSEENPGLWARIQQARARSSQGKPGEPRS